MSLAPRIASSDFVFWATIIRSDQIPQEAVPSLLRANPEFASWYCKRYLKPASERPKKPSKKAA
jgi:hypothetical protein